MRFIIPAGAAALALGLALPNSAAAGGKRDWVCWMTPTSVAECAHLPEPYHFRDIKYKPHSHDGGFQRCRHCGVDFVLSHGGIRDLSNYTSPASMRRFHEGTVYGDKNRGIQD